LTTTAKRTTEGRARTLQSAPAEDHRETIESVVVRFAGDSGDGIQLTGSLFTQATARAGNELATFPDFPAEIRAPTGTPYGVSAFQINFGSRVIKTSGDAPDVLVALNPAALKVNIGDLRVGGLVIVDTGTFSDKNLRKAGYRESPLEDDSLGNHRTIEVDVSKLTLEAVKQFGLSQKEALRCKNMWTLGLVYWLCGRERGATIDWLKAKFGKHPELAAANAAALNAGHAFGETAELSGEMNGFSVAPAEIAPGLYRTLTGSDGLAWGLLAGARLAGLELMLGSYPITPASPILHALARLKHFGVVTFQAEDEIAAICAAIGASYAGSLGVTSSSGPGIALKAEALGLAAAVELPLIVINSQRAGPSTGKHAKITTKIEHDRPAVVMELAIDTNKNRPETIKQDITHWEKTTGTRLEISIVADYTRGNGLSSSHPAGSPRVSGNNRPLSAKSTTLLGRTGCAEHSAASVISSPKRSTLRGF